VAARVRDALANRTVITGADLLDEARLSRFLASLRRRPPALVRGVPEALYILARRVLEQGDPLRAVASWSGGNTLYPTYREAIESAFACRLHTRYSCEEVGSIAFECPEAGALHVAAESAIVEVVREDGTPADPGELGRVLVTGLRNRAMPIVRYELGDRVVAPDDTPCPCGRSLPLLGELVGRSNALLVTSEGGFVPPNRVAAVFWAAADSVLEFRVAQARDRRLRVTVVQRDEPDPGAVRSRIAVELDLLLGFAGATTVERVDEIGLDPLEKLAHVTSEAHG
jgi:phenylacetate-CoA ligase